MAKDLSRSSSASKPVRKAPPSVRSTGSSSAKAAVSLPSKGDSSEIRSAQACRAPPGKAANSSFNKGKACSVSLMPPSSRGLRSRFWRRARMRGTSRTPLSDSPSRDDAPACLKNSPTAACRRWMTVKSVEGSASHKASWRAPAGVAVLSMASSKDVSREPLVAAKSSRLREDAASRRTAAPNLASMSRNRFLGRSQSESVT